MTVFDITMIAEHWGRHPPTDSSVLAIALFLGAVTRDMLQSPARVDMNSVAEQKAELARAFASASGQMRTEEISFG